MAAPSETFSPEVKFRVTQDNFRPYLQEIIDTVRLVIKHRDKYGDGSGQGSYTSSVLKKLDALDTLVRDENLSVAALADCMTIMGEKSVTCHRDGGLTWRFATTDLVLDVFMPIRECEVVAFDVVGWLKSTGLLVVAYSDGVEARRKQMAARETILRCASVI